MLTREKKEGIIKKHKAHDKDTGSTEVQVAVTSETVTQLLEHLKTHPKDMHSKRGLLKMISKRRSLLAYLKQEDTKRYNALVKSLGLKK